MGLRWLCHSDMLWYKSWLLEYSPPTMRNIYRALASQYGSIGLLTSFTEGQSAHSAVMGQEVEVERPPTAWLPAHGVANLGVQVVTHGRHQAASLLFAPSTGPCNQ